MQQPHNQPSLTARALRLLARREHSALELRRKLRPHARDDAELQTLMTDLTHRGWFSEARFVEQLARTRSGKYGAARIEHELRRHRVSEDALIAVITGLRADELERAWAVWCRRFGRLEPNLQPGDGTPAHPPEIERAASLPSSRAEPGPLQFARQRRFLEQRGFSPETVHAVMRRAARERVVRRANQSA
jgi:regulatory protein